MPDQSTHEARGLVGLALKRLEPHDRLAAVHPGVVGHLRAAEVHLDAACSLLTFAGRDGLSRSSRADGPEVLLPADVPWRAA